MSNILEGYSPLDDQILIMKTGDVETHKKSEEDEIESDVTTGYVSPPSSPNLFYGVVKSTGPKCSGIKSGDSVIFRTYGDPLKLDGGPCYLVSKYEVMLKDS